MVVAKGVVEVAGETSVTSTQGLYSLVRDDLSFSFVGQLKIHGTQSRRLLHEVGLCEWAFRQPSFRKLR